LKKIFCMLIAFSLWSSLPSPAAAAPLHDAVLAGDLAKVRQLLDQGADINDTAGYSYTPLQMAAGEGKDEIAKFLIDRGADINADEDGRGTPLRRAAIQGHFEIIDLLLDRGAESDDPMEAATLLVHAVSKGDLETINKLLSRGIDVNAEPLNPEPYDTSLNALHTSIETGNADITELLIKHGAQITPFNMNQAICKKDLGLVKLLIKSGAKIENGTLAQSVECGNKEVLTYLMTNAGTLDYAGIAQNFPSYDDSGSRSTFIIKELFEILYAKDADLKSHAGSAMSNALVTGNSELVKFLLDKGVSLTNGDATMLYAAQNGRAEIVDLLLKHDIKADVRSEWGNTPLLRAVPYNQTKVAALLLESGADPNAKNELFNTPLHMAAARNLTEMSALLLKNGARVNALNVDRNTPLHQAVRFPGKFDTIKLLLDAKANVNAKNRRGMTPLHYLAIRNSAYKDYDEQPSQKYYQDPDGLADWQRPYSEQVKEDDRIGAARLLLGSGADPNIQNSRGESALDLARAYSKNPEFVHLLEAQAGTAKP
jgi:ankyrin repeat protein